MSTRESALNNWLQSTLDLSSFTLTPLAGDASFRRYFRLQTADQHLVIMDAPPHREPILPFIQIAQSLKKQGIHTPDILAFDITQGFIVLEDFGDMLLFNTLSSETHLQYYHQALQTLTQLQRCSTTNPSLPLFDSAFMKQEMSLFETWFLEGLLDIALSAHEKTALADIMNRICHQLSNQPKCFIHRDYHARNLLVFTPVSSRTPAIGVIDFQDAMQGPFTYDLVSLIKDCYVHWSGPQQQDWIAYFYEQMPHKAGWSLDEFHQGVDWCGLQRHLKVLGIFSRLHLRDHKSAYLHDLPLTLHHTIEVLSRYPELEFLYDLMQNRVLPKFSQFKEKQPA